MSRKILTFCSFAIFLFLFSVASFASSEYVYTAVDIEEESQISYFSSISGNYTPMAITLNSGISPSGFDYDFSAASSIPTSGNGQGGIKFDFNTVNPVSVPDSANSVTISFKCDARVSLPGMFQELQKVNVYINGTVYEVSGVTVDRVDISTIQFRLFSDVSFVKSGSVINGFSIDSTYRWSNPTSSIGRLDCYCIYPEYIFSEDDVTAAIGKATQDIIDNNNQNTERIVSKIDEGVNKVVDGDPANQPVLDNQQAQFDEITEAESSFNDTITENLDVSLNQVISRLSAFDVNIKDDPDLNLSKDGMKDLYEAIIPRSTSWYAQFFIILPIAIALFTMFTVKVLRNVGSSGIVRKISGREGQRGGKD